MVSSAVRKRRIGGWGFEGEHFPPSHELLEWLEARIGAPEHPVTGSTVTAPDIVPQTLPDLTAEVSNDPLDRLAHARGQGLVDVLRVRTGSVPALPDGVCRPASADEVEETLRRCAAAGVRVIPWGGGTSVTGGVNVLDDAVPVISMDLERLSGLVALDEVSGLATFGPGTPGPAVEQALAEHGLTLGHFPQSWELATVGGWVAARSSGQESLGYGRIEDMVAGLELVAPSGRLRLPALPASAAGPDLRQLVLGSEGRLGVITEVSLRVRPRPDMTVVEAALLPGIEPGLAAAREMVVCGIPLSLLRLSDASETQVAMAVGLAVSSAAPLVRLYLRLRSLGKSSCLMLYGAAGGAQDSHAILGCARATLRRHRAAILGRGPGRHWQEDRFRHPYLRESLLDLGYATDTLETATPWSQTIDTRQTVAHAIATSLEAENERVTVLSHVSHPYRDGASLYFTFFFRCADHTEATIHRWATIKRAANEALVACGATLSHHHGIGQWHAPWLEAEVGPRGHAVLEGAARELDPDGILNPHVLLTGIDRLEQ